MEPKDRDLKIFKSSIREKNHLQDIEYKNHLVCLYTYPQSEYGMFEVRIKCCSGESSLEINPIMPLYIVDNICAYGEALFIGKAFIDGRFYERAYKQTRFTQ